MAKRLLLLTGGAILALGSIWTAFAAQPAAPTLPSPGGGGIHGAASGHVAHRISKFDASIGLEPVTRTAPRSMAVAPSAVTTGTWTALGPTPIADEKNLGTSAATTSDFGRTSGRVTSLGTDPSNPNIIYLGTAGGGVWKSADGGASWSTATDSQPSIAIGSLAVDAAGTTIYAATGEDNASGDSQRGQGILKSIDAGATWTVVGQSTFAQFRIGGIVVDKATSGATERVFAATDHGLFVSANSGSTWAQVALTITPIAGQTASQRVMQVLQDSTNRFWVVASDFCQTEVGNILTSANGTVWSTSFTAPSGAGGRIALGIGTGGTVAYAALATCANFGNLAGIWKTGDSGGTWLQTAGTPPQYFSFPGVTPPQSQGWYDNVVAVDQTNSNNAAFGGITVIATGDGGATFTDIGQSYNGGVIHPDYHALLFTSANTFYAGNDGGIWQGKETLGTGSVSASWTNLNANLNTIQFYSGSALDTSHVLGGSQDNGSPGISPGSAAVGPAWQEYLDGDGGYSAIDPTSGSSVIYATTAQGQIWKGSYAPPASPDPYWPYDTFTEADPCLSSCSSDPSVAFSAPLLMDQSNPSRLLTARTKVYQSTSGGLPAGSGWAAISPSLATVTPPPGAGSDFIASMTMGKTPSTTGTVWTGSYFGAVWQSSNATGVGATWTNATGNLPAFNLTAHVSGNAWISGVAVNPTNTSEAWVTIGAIGVGHVWHTTNGGASWADISGTGGSGVPDEIVNGVLLDQSDNTTLYIATDFGVLVCATCSGTAPAPAWSVLGSGLPNVKVDAISQTKAADHLLAWTHGRGAWVIPTGPFPGRYKPLVPARILDTRDGTGGYFAPVGANQSISVQVAGQGNVPAMNSATPPSAVVLNVTVANPTAGSYLTVYPTNAGRPTASNMNFLAQQTVPNLVEVPVGPDGKVNVYNAYGSVDVIFDVQGWVTTQGTASGTDGLLRPLVPVRILDTRFGTGTGGVTTPVGPGQTIHLQVAGAGGVPGTASIPAPEAVVLNVTATNPTAPSYLTVFPTGASKPIVSNLNFVAGQTVPNRVEVKLGTNGQIDIFNAGGTVHVIADVNGWFTDGSDPTAVGGKASGLTPARVLDTRNGTGGFSAPVGPASTIFLQVAANGGVPATSDSVPPTAVVLNVTVTNPTAPSHLTIFPSDATRPNASDLNFVAGQTVPNLVVVKLGANGQIGIFNAAGSTDVIVDVLGWYN